MSQIIDIILMHEGEKYQFTCEVQADGDLVFVKGNASITAQSLTVVPLTNIEAINDYLPPATPDSPQQPIVDDLTAIEMDLYVKCCVSEGVKYANSAVLAFRKFFLKGADS